MLYLIHKREVVNMKINVLTLGFSLESKEGYLAVKCDDQYFTIAEFDRRHGTMKILKREIDL
jgi:hypothetical protein